MAKPTLEQQDFEAAAEALKVPVSRVKAVCEVEAPRGGFDAEDRPRILFEAHHFSRLTGRVYDALHPRISSRTANRSLYTSSNASEHARLAEAVMLNREAALQSASWGRFQIMGFNYGACGFGDVQSFINAMYAGEPEHLQAFVRFLSPAMKTALRNGDWARFAAMYNGPGYKANRYDEKLAAADKKYA